MVVWLERAYLVHVPRVPPSTCAASAPQPSDLWDERELLLSIASTDACIVAETVLARCTGEDVSAWWRQWWRLRAWSGSNGGNNGNGGGNGDNNGNNGNNGIGNGSGGGQRQQ